MPQHTSSEAVLGLLSIYITIAVIINSCYKCGIHYTKQINDVVTWFLVSIYYHTECYT
jgi:hypothetical protein